MSKLLFCYSVFKQIFCLIDDAKVRRFFMHYPWNRQVVKSSSFQSSIVLDNRQTVVKIICLMMSQSVSQSSFCGQFSMS